MDFRSYQQPNHRRSRTMETASLFLGIFALSTICCVYTTLICGALGIVFALLSRGGEMTFSPRAKAGLILSSVGLGIVLLMMIYTLVVANVYYGGVENMLRDTYQSMGIDYDALFNAR